METIAYPQTKKEEGHLIAGYQEMSASQCSGKAAFSVCMITKFFTFYFNCMTKLPSEHSEWPLVMHLSRFRVEESDSPLQQMLLRRLHLPLAVSIARSSS